MNSHTSNSFALLSTHSNTLNCYVCLKSFAVSKEGEMQFLKEYSYYSYFNLESIDDIESSSSEDEIDIIDPADDLFIKSDLIFCLDTQDKVHKY